MSFGFIVNAVPARVGSTASERVMAILIAVIAIAIATAHRGAGFAWPYHVSFRQYEKYHFGMWAPSSIEHMVGGFGLVALVTLIFSCFVAPVTRNRFATGAAFGGCYFVGSTIGWTHLHYVATHDPAKLWEMAADVIGIIVAVLWASWPQATNNAPFALEKP
ncbi:hypothetical protein PQQ99_37125 [Paraburkholderia sediminicola]|uniref:hypothetical protein n=1 Tax=Paraburkholderia sediminicola TaxID=458836 RepID=UPI0038B96D69